MKQVVLGAVTAFAARLSQHHKTMVVGRSVDCAWLVEELGHFAEVSGLGDTSDVDWAMNLRHPPLERASTSDLLREVARRIDL